MKKIICLLSALTLFFTSCSKDDSIGNDPNAPILPVKIVQIFEDGSKYILSNKFEGNKWLGFTTDDGSKANVLYEGNLIKSIKYYYGTELGQEDLYTYDANQKLIKFVRNEYESGKISYLDDVRYTYNSDGTVNYSEYVLDYNGQLVLDETGKITLNSIGEVISKETSYGNKYTYTYDDKNTPYKNILGIDKIFLGDSNPDFGFHNLTKINGSFTEESTFTYNSNNFPVTEINFDGYEVVKYEYYYNK